jgi:hypothetical protein
LGSIDCYDALMAKLLDEVDEDSSGDCVIVGNEDFHGVRSRGTAVMLPYSPVLPRYQRFEPLQ